MRLGKNKIEITNAIVIYTAGISEVQYAVVSAIGTILYMCGIDKLGLKDYSVRKRCVDSIKELRTKFNINTIIIEQNSLFTESIGKYPDPYLLRNVVLGFGIKISIEDAFLKDIENILELPANEWRDSILGRRTRYSFDRCKAHILNKSEVYTLEQIAYIEEHKNYEVLCLADSVNFNNLIHKKYKLKV